MDKTHFIFKPRQSTQTQIYWRGQGELRRCGPSGEGGPDSKITTPFVIFKSKGSSYLILGVRDNMLGVAC